MHATLKPRTNLTLIALSAVLAGAALLFTRPIPVLPALIGSLLGGTVGGLQRRSIANARAAFHEAKTAMDVRRALMSTVPGKQAILLQWAGAFVLLATGLWIGNPLGGGVGGYAMLMCVRDLAALNAVFGLAPGEGAVEQ
jgi:hypothetical protein